MIRNLVFAVAAMILFGAAPALAQARLPGPIASPDGQRSARPRQSNTPVAPAGVPGARAEPALVAPADRVPTDMPPNEALFDAINRGDVVAARDAIGRGADIHGRNVLGLTPLELSVDLGRNEISFLLLSLRGGAGYATSGPPPAADEPKTPAQARAERRAELEARRQQAAAERAAARAGTPDPTPTRNARLFAGDGGAPVPQAGFLGFDSAR